MTPRSNKTDDGETIINQSGTTKKFNTFFTSTMSQILKTVLEINTCDFLRKNFTDENFVLQLVSENLILKQLKYLRVKKAIGLDGIPACLLKSTGTVLDDWKKAHAVPLYKFGGYQNIYRPISILPVVMENVNFQLQQYLQKFDLMSPVKS